MAVSDAKHKANEKWNAQNYDTLLLRFPKGNKAAIKALAQKHDQSVNSFVWSLIQNEMERDAAKEKAGTVSVSPNNSSEEEQ